MKNYLEIEDEIGRLATALISGDGRISKALIANLQRNFPLEEVAGIMLICLERLLSLDSRHFVRAVEHLIPADLMQEVRRLIATTVSKRLIDQGFVPGQDFSVNIHGRLLLTSFAQAALVR
jgi:hypothetical protein